MGNKVGEKVRNRVNSKSPALPLRILVSSTSTTTLSPLTLSPLLPSLLSTFVMGLSISKLLSGLFGKKEMREY